MMKNWFRKSGFIKPIEIDTPIDREQVTDTIQEEDDVLLSRWIQAVDHGDKFQSYDLENYVIIDDNLLTTDIPTDNDVINTVQHSQPYYDNTNVMTKLNPALFSAWS